MKTEFGGNKLNQHEQILTARITAVHRERYQLFCDRGELYARLKTKEYYLEKVKEVQYI